MILRVDSRQPVHAHPNHMPSSFPAKTQHIHRRVKIKQKAASCSLEQLHGSQAEPSCKSVYLAILHVVLRQLLVMVGCLLKDVAAVALVGTAAVRRAGRHCLSTTCAPQEVPTTPPCQQLPALQGGRWPPWWPHPQQQVARHVLHGQQSQQR